MFRVSRATQATLLLLAVAAGAAKGQLSTDTYQYDARGRLAIVQTGGGVKTTYSHDPADNRSNVKVLRQGETTATQEKWEAESLPHATGFAQYAGWGASVGSPVTAMTYGPYTNSVPSGAHTAVWRMLIDNNASLSADAVVVLDVNDSEANQVIASRVLTAQSFAASMAYQVFELPFFVDLSRVGHHLEFRTWCRCPLIA